MTDMRLYELQIHSVYHNDIDWCWYVMLVPSTSHHSFNFKLLMRSLPQAILPEVRVFDSCLSPWATVDTVVGVPCKQSQELDITEESTHRRVPAQIASAKPWKSQKSQSSNGFHSWIFRETTGPELSDSPLVGYSNAALSAAKPSTLQGLQK